MVEISVVVPVYNVEEFLGECLDSIVNQTFKDIEIICVNDGSPDNSLEILNDYASRDNRFIVIDQENGGHAVASNRGIDIAKGKYLFLMDSDDILDLNAFEHTYKLAEEKNVDFVLFQAINYFMDKNELVEAENYSMNALADHVGDSIFNWQDVKDFVFKITVTPWSKLYNREFIIKNNIRFPEGLVFDDNVFFFDVLFSAERITFLREHLFKRRWYSSSSTTSGGVKFLDYIPICGLIWDVFSKHGVFDEFKEGLFEKKVGTINFWYNGINKEFKQEFFDRMKDDYLHLTEDEEFFEDFFNYLTDKQRRIFESVFESDVYTEFDLKLKYKELMENNIHLKEKLYPNLYENKKIRKNYYQTYLKTIKLKNENKKLLLENNQLKEKINELSK